VRVEEFGRAGAVIADDGAEARQQRLQLLGLGGGRREEAVLRGARGRGFQLDGDGGDSAARLVRFELEMDLLEDGPRVVDRDGERDAYFVMRVEGGLDRGDGEAV